MAGNGTLGVIQLAVAAGEPEALFCVDKSALTHHVEGIVIDQHGNIHFHIQPILAIFQFFPNFLALPVIPERHMVENTVFRLQKAGLRQFILCAALMAGQVDTLALHLSLCTAMGTFIEDTVQTVCPEGFVNNHLVLLLPAEVIKGECLLDLCVQLRHRQGLQFFPGDQAGHIRHNGCLALLQVVVKGLTEVGTLGNHRYHRHIQFFQKNTHFLGQNRSGTVKGISGFREHEHRGFLLLQHILHIPDQAHIADKFLGGDAAQKRHQQTHHRANKAIGGGDDAVALGEENMGCDLQIRKAGVIHQNEAGFFLSDFLHCVLSDRDFQRKQFKEGQHTNQDLQQNQGPQRIAVLGFGHLHNLFIGAFSCRCFHKYQSTFIKLYTMILLYSPSYGKKKYSGWNIHPL